MKKLSVQFQPHRAPELKLDELRAVMEAVANDKALVERHWFEEGEEEVRYCNFTFETKSLAGLWRRLRLRIFEHASWGDTATRAAIVTCEGKEGWDDYLILSHFDPSIARAPMDYLEKLSRPSADFDLPPDTAVMSCRRVVEGAPILRVSRDDDGEWQFLCGEAHGEGSGCSPKMVTLSHVLKLDGSVKEVADLCTRGSASRNAAGGEWAVHDGHEDVVLDHVRRFGWHVAGVEEGESGPAFAYSIGAFQSFGLPEIILFGLPMKSMQSIINVCVDEFKAAGGPPKLGEPVQGILEGFPVVFRKVGEDYFRGYLGYALWFYKGRDFPVLQCIWPDKQGRFPWETGFSEDLLPQQPLLG